MSVAEYLLLFLMVLAGGMLFFLTGKSNSFYLKLSLSFTGAYLFAISMIHLLPDVFASGIENAGYFILLGFFIQLILEYFSEGIEHGHIHDKHHHHKAFPLAMMAGLCIHSFLEGMPLSGNFNDEGESHSLLTGIILHHLPVAFALVSMLSDSGISKRNSIFYLVIFAAMAPAGALFSHSISGLEMMNIKNYFAQIMAVVIGIFLHISTTILFESSSQHRFNLYKLVVIILGALVAFIH
jgi:zinc and cadmium transporter